MKALNDLKSIVDHAERGIAEVTADNRLKAYRVNKGDMFERRDTGEQFIVYGVSSCNRLYGVGLNYDHNGYVYRENCKRISYKDIRPFKAKHEVSIQKESNVPSGAPERESWFDSEEASRYINRPRRALTSLAKNGGIQSTRIPKTRKLIFHRLWLDAYLMGYGAEPTTEEEAELERLNRY